MLLSHSVNLLPHLITPSSPLLPPFLLSLSLTWFSSTLLSHIPSSSLLSSHPSYLSSLSCSLFAPLLLLFLFLILCLCFLCSQSLYLISLPSTHAPSAHLLLIHFRLFSTCSCSYSIHFPCSVFSLSSVSKLLPCALLLLPASHLLLFLVQLFY